MNSTRTHQWMLIVLISSYSSNKNWFLVILRVFWGVELEELFINLTCKDWNTICWWVMWGRYIQLTCTWPRKIRFLRKRASPFKLENQNPCFAFWSTYKLKWIFRIMFSLSSTSRSKHLCQHFRPGHPPGEKKGQTVESEESKECFKPSRHTKPTERFHVQGYRNPFIFQITSNARINSTPICLVPCNSCN